MFNLFGNSNNISDDKGVPPTQNTPTTPGATEPQEELSALDKISKLLYPEGGGKNGEKGDGSSNTPNEPVDPTKLFENKEAVNTLLASLDFTRSISPETQSLLEAGKSEGFTAMVNDISKASFLEALKISSALNKQTIEDAVKRTLSQSKGQIDESLGDLELRRAMPQLDNPVIRLGLDALKDRLKAQNPSMSPTEIATQLKSFLKGANELVNPDPTVGKGNKADETVESWLDWASK